MPLLSLGNIQLDQVLGEELKKTGAPCLLGILAQVKRPWRCNLLRIQLCHIYPVHMYVLIKNQKKLWKKPFKWMGLLMIVFNQVH